MPYVPPSNRQSPNLTEPGDLAYVIYRACLEYIAAHGVSYRSYATILGVLQSVSLEFYRRQVGPYEDLKRVENGDVYA